MSENKSGGWNRPAANQPTAKRNAKAPSQWRGIAAGLVVVVVTLGVACYFMFGTSLEAPKREVEKKGGRIKAVAPAVTNKVEELKDGLTAKQREWKARKCKRNPWGTPIPKDLEYKPPSQYTYEDYVRLDPGYALRYAQHKERMEKVPWKTSADWDLAVLLFSDPSQGGGYAVPIDQRFVGDFLKSLETPIIISKDDTEELKEQKRQLIDTKIYLKAQLDKGVDIVQLLKDEQRARDRLRGLRQNLEQELRALEKEATSTQEIDDYVTAANKMLEKEGISNGIKLPKSFHRMRLERAEAAEKVPTAVDQQQ